MSLLASLTRGFIDHTVPTPAEQLLPALLTNDRGQGKTVLSSVLRHLGESHQFWMTVAFATKGGVATLLNTLRELEERGIPGRILVSQYLNFTQPEALRALRQFKNLELKIATTGNLHAKGYLFRKAQGYDVIIGSSNLTAGALKVNKEWNLQVSTTEEGELVRSVRAEFEQVFARATPVEEGFLASYQLQYAARLRPQPFISQPPPVPNAMQVAALANLSALRQHLQRKALLISATGTGKTYLAAFDAHRMGARKLLFVVHRTTIVQAAIRTFARVFGQSRTLGEYSSTEQDLTVDFLFCTIQTLSQLPHLHRFPPAHFDYIVVDETHRLGAESYQRLLSYFTPAFLLGMTATPERTDGYDIFAHFDHNIAYEIRLQQALEEDMLCPFHYFGITDISVGGNPLPEQAGFSLLVAEERIAHILAKAQFYGCDNGVVRGLVFCRTISEAHALSAAFNKAGLRTLALDGGSSEKMRTSAIERLESEEHSPTRLDYLFTVDIFNEGIDIPRLNQVLLLRPTQSPIVFVQQLGRGLRKTEGKDHLTVLDFIGNYATNYLIPIALFGDTSYNKDTLRKLVAAGSTLLPGASTINFDRIAQHRIYASIDKARLNTKRDLVQAYNLLKFTIGRPPLMLDFIEHGARDPFSYVTQAGSFFNFAAEQETGLSLPPLATDLLVLISTHLANAQRIEEVEILCLLLQEGEVSFPTLQAHLRATYGPATPTATITSCLRNLNFDFIRKPQPVIRYEENMFRFTQQFLSLTKLPLFRQFLLDTLHFAQARYRAYQATSSFHAGFFLYHKYSRRDVCRILNWEVDESATLFGYKLKGDHCPLFVNYHKESTISERTNYEDGFTSPHKFHWVSKSNRTLSSPELVAMQQGRLRLPLFIKKSNGEGTDFYYMGEVAPTSFTPSTISAGKGEHVPVVKVDFALTPAVQESLYTYLTTQLE